MFYLQATCALAALLSLLGPVDSNPVPLPFSHDVLGGKSIRMPFTKRLSTRSAVKRDGSLVATLSNDVYSYDITIEVGTPAQTVNLQLDTGSSDLFVLAPNSCDTNNCSCPSGGCTYCTCCRNRSFSPVPWPRFDIQGFRICFWHEG